MNRTHSYVEQDMSFWRTGLILMDSETHAFGEARE